VRWDSALLRARGGEVASGLQRGPSYRHCGAEAWPDTPGVLLLREADGRVAGSGSLAGWIGEPIGDRRLLTMLIVGISREHREKEDQEEEHLRTVL